MRKTNTIWRISVPVTIFIEAVLLFRANDHFSHLDYNKPERNIKTLMALQIFY